MKYFYCVNINKKTNTSFSQPKYFGLRGQIDNFIMHFISKNINLLLNNIKQYINFKDIYNNLQYNFK